MESPRSVSSPGNGFLFQSSHRPCGLTMGTDFFPFACVMFVVSITSIPYCVMVCTGFRLISLCQVLDGILMSTPSVDLLLQRVLGFVVVFEVLVFQIR